MIETRPRAARTVCLLAALARQPLTSREVAVLWSQTTQYASAMLRMLGTRGWAERTGASRAFDGQRAGPRGEVWQLTDAGRVAHARSVVTR